MFGRNKMQKIEEVLSVSDEPMTGREIVIECGGEVDRSNVYVYLNRMEDSGAVSSEIGGSGFREYKLTEGGK